MKRISSQSFAFNRGIFSPWSTILLRFILAGILLLLAFAGIAQAKQKAFSIPTGSQPIAITRGPDGNFWFTLQNSSQVARITPDGVITEFRTPTLSFPFDITSGPDGNIWFSEGSNGQIGFITPEGKITEIRFSNFDASSGITTGPDGNIWFCDLTGNNIWRYNLATKQLRKFPVPTPNAFPEEITVGPDRALWFTEGIGGKIGRITTDGIITEFGSGLNSPRSIIDGPDGNVWFTLSFAPHLGRITPGGEITFFPTPNNPEHLTRGPGDTLLFSEFGVSKIASISTTDGVVTESDEFEFAQPTGIVGGFKHDAWFLGFGDNKVYHSQLPR
jgi:virginiamycin B lyase